MQSVGSVRKNPRADCWWDKVDVFGSSRSIAVWILPDSQTLPPHGIRQSDQVGEGKAWELRGMDEAIWAMLPFLDCFGPKRFPKEAVERGDGGLPKPEACELRPCEWAGAEILRLVPSNRNLKTTGLDEDLLLTCCFAPSVSPPAEGTVARTGWDWPAGLENKRREETTPQPSFHLPAETEGPSGFAKCDKNKSKEARGDPGVPSLASNGPKRVRCMRQGHFFILIGQPLACLQDHSDVRKITPARHGNDGTVRGALPFQTTGQGKHREQGGSIMNAENLFLRGPDFRNYRGSKSPGGAQRALNTVQFRPGVLER
ncbi:uncharacterized protein B0T23DRAFT_411179 [Neurospora hispaniola]|uniref:Uncharacterized protein n=1 Tax=Neurospora hispaniola TaxID=588809 RepID=A0AAJ0MUR9_9PEZI|nr:hypothetical protein B0T23DRAFT_411179 [Neurospora hispaniola]